MIGNIGLELSTKFTNWYFYQQSIYQLSSTSTTRQHPDSTQKIPQQNLQKDEDNQHSPQEAQANSL